MMKSIDVGKTEKIKESGDPFEKKNFFYMVEAMALDQLYKLHNVEEQEIQFAVRYYKTEQEPVY